MNKLYVVMRDNELVGVYTTHRKAIQTLLIDTLKEGMTLKEYTFEFGVEFFTYIGPNPVCISFGKFRKLHPMNGCNFPNLFRCITSNILPCFFLLFMVYLDHRKGG